MKKLLTFALSFVSAFCLGGCNSQAASIGIIGGADGPTAIFVTSRINWWHIGGVICGILVAILIALVYRKKK